MSDYKIKFNKYHNKCKYFEKMLDITYQQKGGKLNEGDYIEQLEEIEKIIKKKGSVFWFDEELKILSKSNSETKARDEIVKKIKKNTKKWSDKLLCKIVINFDYENIMDKKTGGLDISVEVNKVNVYENNEGIEKLLINQRDRHNSLLRLFYKYDELTMFDINDLKKIADMMINNKMKKIGSLKYYSYSDIEKFV